MTDSVEKPKEKVKDGKANELVARPPIWPLWKHLEDTAESLKTTVEWLEIRIDPPITTYATEQFPGYRISNFLLNRKNEQLTQILSSLEKAAGPRLAAQRVIWEGEASQWAKDPGAIFVQYPEWDRKDAEEPDDDEKEKNVETAIGIVARLRSLTLKQYIDFLIKEKIHANVCGHTAYNLERILGYKGDKGTGKCPDYGKAETLGKTLAQIKNKHYYCRIDVGPHAFVLQYMNEWVMLYQSWVGYYTLAQRLQYDRDNQYKLKTFVDALRLATELDAPRIQEKLFGIRPMEMRKKKTRKYRIHTEIPGDDQIQDNIKKMWAENEKEWDARLAYDGDMRLQIHSKYDPKQDKLVPGTD